MTKRECAIVMAYTGVCMLKGDNLKYFYEYVSELMGKPMHTSEIGEQADIIKELAKDDFFELCATATDESDVIPDGTDLNDLESPGTYVKKDHCNECRNYNPTSLCTGWCCVLKGTVGVGSEANFMCKDRFEKRGE